MRLNEIRLNRKEDGTFRLRFERHPDTKESVCTRDCPDIRRAVLLIKHYYGIPHPKRHYVLCQEKDHEAKAILARKPGHP